MKKLIEWLMAFLGIKKPTPEPVQVPVPAPEPAPVEPTPVEQPVPDPVIIPMPPAPEQPPVEEEPEPLPPAAETPPVYIPPVVVEVPVPAPPVIAPPVIAPVPPVPAPPVVEHAPPVIKPPVVVQPTPIKEPSLLSSPITWGVAFKEADLSNQTVINETYKQFKSVTGENSMKPGHVQPSQGKFDFTHAKALVKIAKAKGIRIHGHACFVWPSQEKNLPAFWHEAAKDKATYIALLKNTVQTTVREFKNDITSWDITNEAHDNNGKPRPCYALTHLGPTYHEQIAKWILEVQPSTKLFMSDYDFETASKKAGVVIDYAGTLARKGLIHGISSQMHTNLKMDYKTYKKQLDRMAAAGLLVHLSELDIACKPTEEAQKAAKYKEIATGFRTIPGALQYGITTWSHTNGKNFMNYKKVPAPYAPAIFDNDFNGGLTLPAILGVA
jgi:endo-1,4-beta-xylanase